MLLDSRRKLDMGCSQSKINLYPKKSKSKDTEKKSMDVSDSVPEGDTDEASLCIVDGKIEDFPNEIELDTQEFDLDLPIMGSMELPLTARRISTTGISCSQLNFFRLLDEKIESGRDYNSGSDSEVSCEERTKTNQFENTSLTTSAEIIPTRLLRSTNQSRLFSQSVIHESYGVTSLISQPRNTRRHTSDDLCVDNRTSLECGTPTESLQKTLYS